jgi:putative sterol carrier protein
MAQKEEVLVALNGVKGKLESPALQPSFQDFTKTMQFNFPDLNTSFLFRIENGALKELSESSVEKPDISVTSSSDTLLAIMNRKMGAMSAYTTGKLKVRGSMKDLLKLQKLM